MRNLLCRIFGHSWLYHPASIGRLGIRCKRCGRVEVKSWIAVLNSSGNGFTKVFRDSLD